MREALQGISMEATWGGGGSPFAVSWRKLMMWVFLIGDMLLFAGFLASYGFARLSSEIGRAHV